MRIAYLLLLHQLRVRAVVDDISTKDRSGQNRIDLLRIDILQLPIEDEIVSSSAKVDGGLLSQQNERKNITILHHSQSASHVAHWHRLRMKQRTFSLHSKKNLYGSMPYVTVLPMMGNQ
jgi:hypothetical protein